MFVKNNKLLTFAANLDVAITVFDCAFYLKNETNQPEGKHLKVHTTGFCVFIIFTLRKIAKNKNTKKILNHDQNKHLYFQDLQSKYTVYSSVRL